MSSYWRAAGLLLVIAHGALALLSIMFHYRVDPLDLPILAFVIIEVLAGIAYLSLLWLIPRSSSGAGLLALILVVGLAMRLVMFPSTPILEDDFHRYLWDGGVLANGHDPYRHSPAEVLRAAGATTGEEDLAELAELAESSGPVAKRINHPELRTLYPPVAQAAFALTYWIDPWSITAWRVVLLLCDLLTVAVLYLCLRTLNRSPLWLALYWWNPVLVKEIHNSAHMDGLLLPVLVAVVLLALAHKGRLASACLALAAAIKIWPVLLLPVVIRPLLHRTRELLGALTICAATVLVIGYWMHGSVSGGNSGLAAFVGRWEMNDAFFVLFHWTVNSVLTFMQLEWIDSDRLARVILVMLLASMCLWINWRPAASPEELCRRFLVLAAALFLLSPAPFPWYYTWLLPFLVLVPSFPLLLLTVLLPLYYLRFYLAIRGEAALFDFGIVWLEHLPVWALLARDWLLSIRREPLTRFQERGV